MIGSWSRALLNTGLVLAAPSAMQKAFEGQPADTYLGAHPPNPASPVCSPGSLNLAS